MLAARAERAADASLAAIRARLLFANVLSNDSLLDFEEAARSIEVAGSDARLACLRLRLDRKERLTVAALGGSISAGSSYQMKRGNSTAWLHHAKFVRVLQSAWPSADGKEHVHLQAAMPATGPAWVEHCLEDLLGTHVAIDLVLVEFAVNLDGQSAAFERMLRRLLGWWSRPAVIVISTHEWPLFRMYGGDWHVRPGCWQLNSSLAAGEPDDIDAFEQRQQQSWRDLANDGDEDAIARLCAHYGVPLVSMRAALLPAVRSGAVRLRRVMSDCRHPSGVGHTMLAQVAMTRLLLGAEARSLPRACVPASASLPTEPPTEPSTEPLAAPLAALAEPLGAELPLPLLPDGWPMRSSQCAPPTSGAVPGCLAHRTQRPAHTDGRALRVLQVCTWLAPPRPRSHAKRLRVRTSEPHSHSCRRRDEIGRGTPCCQSLTRMLMPTAARDRDEIGPGTLRAEHATWQPCIFV